jgi:dephospho-CoA kinase
VSDSTHIPVIGIVGGIGSGKSALARWVAARHDVLLLGGDEIGHEVLSFPDVQEALRRRFGTAIFGPDGQVDRKALGRAVFGPTAAQQAALKDLESVVHPRIRERIQQRIAEAEAAGKSGVLLDAAVLFEAGWNEMCHAVVFVDVPRDQRLRRLQLSRGWDEAELARREASQSSLETKRQRSDVVIENDLSLEAAGRRLEQVLAEIRGASD